MQDVMRDVLRYGGKRVIVTGAGSGTGAATARILVELGAEVHTIDLDKPDITGLASFTPADLRDPAQIDRAVAKIGKIVNGLFNCACAAGTAAPLDAMLVDFCGLRHLTEAVIPLMIPGSAVASVASGAGVGWMQDRDLLSGLIATPDVDAARAWCAAHPEAMSSSDGLSNAAVNRYTASRSLTLAGQGIRINCVNRAPADAPVPLGRDAVDDEQAWPLVFLNSPRASFVTGAQLGADGGFGAGVLAAQIDPVTRGE